MKEGRARNKTQQKEKNEKKFGDGVTHGLTHRVLLNTQILCACVTVSYLAALFVNVKIWSALA